jgi:hypothetical protein
MLYKKSFAFSTKFELFVLIGCSMLVFLAGSMFLLVCFGADVLGFFGKEKLSQQFDKFFDELFEF